MMLFEPYPQFSISVWGMAFLSPDAAALSKALERRANEVASWSPSFFSRRIERPVASSHETYPCRYREHSPPPLRSSEEMDSQRHRRATSEP